MTLDIFTDKKKEKELKVFLNGSIDSETYFDLENRLQEVLLNPPEIVVLDLVRL